MESTIEVICKRKDVNGYDDPTIISKRDLSDALELFVNYELGYGGVITEVTDLSITTKTHVLGKIDTTIFTASNKDDILPFLYVAGIWCSLKLNKNLSKVIDDGIFDICNGHPLYVTKFAPILIGQSFLKTFKEEVYINLVAKYGISWVPSFDGMNIRDLWAVIQLKQQGYKIKDILDLLH